MPTSRPGEGLLSLPDKMEGDDYCYLPAGSYTLRFWPSPFDYEQDIRVAAGDRVTVIPPEPGGAGRPGLGAMEVMAPWRRESRPLPFPPTLGFGRLDAEPAARLLHGVDGRLIAVGDRDGDLWLAQRARGEWETPRFLGLPISSAGA